MSTQPRLQAILGFLKRSLIRIVIFGLLLAIAGVIYQTASAEADQSKFPAPGNLIDVGGFKLHIYCTGEGSPTIIMETLSGGTSSHWGWVQPEVAKTTRVCVYDRAGRGWSEPDPEPISLARTVRNLHTLLTNANIDGPYLLVGHSIGGIYVRQYAADYPKDVVGLALLDASHPQQFDRYPEMLKENEGYLQISAVFPTMARLGIFRLYFTLGGEIDFADLTEPQKSQIKALWSSPSYFMSQRAEVSAGQDIFTDGQNLGDLGDLPLIVISAGPSSSSSWRQLQSELASLSTNSIQLTLEKASHVSLVFNPNDARDVSQAILQIAEAIRTGNKLNP
jgi:pimeloyl-ACP methyl ester carboxylesterase